MILSGQQPNYLPWIGLFAKIAASDRFAIVDHVQYIRRSVITRNSILGVDGAPIQLTVPVLTHGRTGQRIVDVEIDEHEPWRRKHFKSLRFCYRGAPFWSEHAPFFEDVYGRRWDRLADLNVAILEYLLGAFGLDVPVRRTTELDIAGAKTGMLVSMCRAFDCDGYLSGAGARKYVDEAVFADAGLSHRFHEFEHPTYAQGKHREFVSNLSAVDLLFWCGPEAGRVVRGET